MLFLLFSLLPLAFAQYNYGSSGTSSTQASSTATSSSSSSVQTVTVGKSGFNYSPSSLVVAPGKQVVFQFYPGDHSVTQSSFEKPCQPLNSSSFFSGFINSNSGPAAQAFTLTVNDTNPIWFYCAQVSHCQSGMVGVINPPSSGNTLDQYKSAAASSGSSSAPANAQGGVVGSPSSSTQATTSSSTSASPTSAGTSAGMGIADLVPGSLVLAMAMGFFAFMV